MHVANATLRKDRINTSNKLQVKFCQTLCSNMSKTKCLFFVQKYLI